MNGRDAEIVLTTLLGVSAETLYSWLAAEVAPPAHVWIAPTIIDTATAETDRAG